MGDIAWMVDLWKGIYILWNHTFL